MSCHNFYLELMISRKKHQVLENRRSVVFSDHHDKAFTWHIIDNYRYTEYT